MSKGMGDPASELLASGCGTRKSLSEAKFLPPLGAPSSSKIDDRPEGQVSSSSFKSVKQRGRKCSLLRHRRGWLKALGEKGIVGVDGRESER